MLTEEQSTPTATTQVQKPYGMETRMPKPGISQRTNTPGMYKKRTQTVPVSAQAKSGVAVVQVGVGFRPWR